MLLKNKAPSNKPKCETSKSQKSPPKPFKTKSFLKKVPPVKNESKVNTKSTIDQTKMAIGHNVVSDKIIVSSDKVDEGVLVKKETSENDNPNVVVKEMKKNDLDIINLSVSDNIVEPGIYYKQEPLIKTFSDTLRVSNRKFPVDFDNESDIVSTEVIKKVDVVSRKRKNENEQVVSNKKLKVLETKTGTSESSSNDKLNNIATIKNQTEKNNNVDDIIFTLGSIVWAKAPGFCWWPAIIDNDPDIDIYYWYEDDSESIAHYHVTFLDDDVSRCWILTRNIKVFYPDPEMKSNNIRTCKKVHLKMLNKAIETAEKCLNLEPKSRLDQYSFTVRFNGKSNIWSRAAVKKPIKAKNDNDFQSLDVEASVIEEKSKVLATANEQSKNRASAKNDHGVKEENGKKKMKKTKIPKANDEE